MNAAPSVIVPAFQPAAVAYRGLGLIKEDYTKHQFRVTAARVAPLQKLIKDSLPASFDAVKQVNDPNFGIMDQGQQGSCVACSVREVSNFLLNKVANDVNNHAAQYTYNLRPNYPDEGMSFSDLPNLLQTYGVVHEADYPYGKSIVGPKDVPANIVALGKQHIMSASSFANITSLPELKAALLHRSAPVLIAFDVYNFSTYFWRQQAGDEYQGGHCVSLYGYDDNTKQLFIQNHWGTDWGLDLNGNPSNTTGGYTRMTYDEFTGIQGKSNPAQLGCYTFVTLDETPPDPQPQPVNPLPPPPPQPQPQPPNPPKKKGLFSCLS